jgi:hypothetical protein
MSHSPLPSRVWCHHPLSFDPTKSRVESSRLLSASPSHTFSALPPAPSLQPFDANRRPARYAYPTTPAYKEHLTPPHDFRAPECRTQYDTLSLLPKGLPDLPSVRPKSRFFMCAGWVVTVQLPLPQQTNPTSTSCIITTHPTRPQWHSPTPRPNLTSLLCF